MWETQKVICNLLWVMPSKFIKLSHLTDTAIMIIPNSLYNVRRLLKLDRSDLFTFVGGFTFLSVSDAQCTTIQMHILWKWGWSIWSQANLSRSNSFLLTWVFFHLYPAHDIKKRNHEFTNLKCCIMVYYFLIATYKNILNLVFSFERLHETFLNSWISSFVNFLTAISHRGLRNDFFSLSTHLLSLFYLDFDLFSIFPIAVWFWISTKLFCQNRSFSTIRSRDGRDVQNSSHSKIAGDGLMSPTHGLLRVKKKAMIKHASETTAKPFLRSWSTSSKQECARKNKLYGKRFSFKCKTRSLCFYLERIHLQVMV